METVPVVIPLTVPVEPTVAIAVLLLLQAPPPASISAVVAPGQTWAKPVITGGPVFTVTDVVTAQPPGRV
jgi:hypothetical protein